MKTHHHKFRRENSRRAFTLIELLVVIGIIAILAALLMPSLGRAKMQAHNVVCVSQLRQLGIAVRLFAEDNDAKLPAAEMMPSAPLNPQRPNGRICDILGPYAGKAANTTNSAPVFHCPGDRFGFFETEGSSYAWNWELSGKQIDNKSTLRITAGNARPLAIDFETSPVMFDYDDFHPRPPHTARNAVYGDGHVDKFFIALPPSPF